MKILRINKVFLLFFLFLLLGCETERNTYITAFKLWKKGKYEEAISKFSSIVFKNKRSKYGPMSEYNIGNIYSISLKRYELAVIEYQKAIVLADFKGKYAYLSQKAIADIYKNEFKSYEKAIYEYKNLFKYKDAEVELTKIIENIYRCFMIKKLYNDGEKELLNYLSRFKIKKDDKANIYMMLGNMVKSDGNWKKAIKYYSKYASSEIYTNEGNFLIAELYYDHKKYTNAKKIYIDLLSKNYKTEIIKEKLKNLEK